uniref:Ig-like domain-containing protein n=1 Tax=Myripristis murdjan TaxID=586833 RepID=A0A668A5W2_9TELE
MACHHQACIIFPQQAILHSPLPHSALLANLKLRPPGLSHGAGVLPDNLNGADGGSVFFTTTVTPPEKTFLVVAWSFNNGSGDREIITSVSSNVIGSGYENRITFDRSTGSLELRNLTMDDTGEYRIVLTPDGGVQKTGDCRLEIFISAASITEPSVTPVEGKPVNLTCDAAGSVLTREWRKDGSPVSPGSNIILHDNNRVLSFSPLKRTDSGEYSCTASNPASSAEAKYKMTVNYGPENVKITGPNEIKVKQTLTLICSAESTPTATYIWMKNGTEIHRNSAEFTKSEIELSDGGEYTCQAGNNITGRTATSDVHRLSVGEWVMLDLSNWCSFLPHNNCVELPFSVKIRALANDKKVYRNLKSTDYKYVGQQLSSQ